MTYSDTYADLYDTGTETGITGSVAAVGPAHTAAALGQVTGGTVTGTVTVTGPTSSVIVTASVTGVTVTASVDAVGPVPVGSSSADVVSLVDGSVVAIGPAPSVTVTATVTGGTVTAVATVTGPGPGVTVTATVVGGDVGRDITVTASFRHFASSLLGFPSETVEYLPLLVTLNGQETDAYDVSVVPRGSRPAGWVAAPYLVQGMVRDTYDVYVRIVDHPEIPVLYVGAFFIG